MPGPTRFIHPDPQPNTPHFGGEPIEMRRLADECGYDYSYLSKIFSGKSVPGPKFAARLAEDLGMSRPDLYAACDDARA